MERKSIAAILSRHVAPGILIAALALAGIGCVLFPAWLMTAPHAVRLGTKDPGDALGLIQAFLALFAGVIAVLALGAAVTAWWLQIRFVDLQEQQKRLEGLSSAQAFNSVSIVDAISNRIPEMTYTQQIPLTVVRTFEGVSRFMETNIDFKANSGLPNPILPGYAKILLAAALSKFAKDPVRPAATDAQTGEPVQLLTTAKALVGRDYSLERTIYVRLAQVHRHQGQFDHAKSALLELHHISRGRNDSRSRDLAEWGLALISLQQGFTDPDKRVEYFREARAKMQQIYRDYYEGIPEHELANFANIAYYMAKSSWCYRLSLGNTPDSECNDQFYTILHHSLNRAFNLLSGNRRNLIQTDPLQQDLAINAIYSSCLAHMLIVGNTLGPEIADKLKSNPQVPGYPVPGEELESYSREIETYVENATAMVDTLINQERDDGVPRFIYTETKERIASLAEFKREMHMIRRWRENRSRMFDFYQSGRA
jgi:hypothetical protein